MCGRDNYMVLEDGTIISGYTGRPVKQRQDKDGYSIVSLCSHPHKVHREVALRHIPNPENKCCVNHKDGNKSNNHVSNLEWVTNLENMQHARETGLFRNLIKGETHPHTQLDCTQALAIKLLYVHGVSLEKLGDEFQTSSSTINRLINGETYTHCESITGYDFRPVSDGKYSTKLDCETARLIKTMNSEGLSGRAISRKLGISLTAVQKVINTITWKHCN